MVGNLDVFQLRPGIDGLLQRLRARGLVLGVIDPAHHWPRLERAGNRRTLFTREVDVPPVACLFVGDRLDLDIAPAKARGMTTIQFRSGRWRRQRPRSIAETAGCGGRRCPRA
jgi:putative hydrolase of the HAD superfamily